MLAAEIARATGQPPAPDVDFAEAETILDAVLAASRRRYDALIAAPAALLSETDPERFR
jgi:hypothetical protein